MRMDGQELPLQSKRYSTPLIILHWGIALLVALQLVMAFLPKFLLQQKTAQIFMELHRSVGFLILIIMLYRLFVRLKKPSPQPTEYPVWQRFAAQLTHGSFYILLIISSLIGWGYVNATGGQVQLFWLLTLPSLMPADTTLALTFLEIHKYLAFALLGLIALHLTATLYNNYRFGHHSFERILLKSSKASFFSYTPVWVRVSCVGAVAIIGVAFVGYSGLVGVDTTRETYAGTFRSVVLIRVAQANWENMKAQFATKKPLSEKEFAQKFRMIKGDLNKSLRFFTKEPMQTTLQLLIMTLDDFSPHVLAHIRQEKPIFGMGLESMADQISQEFDAISQNSAQIIFDASQDFERMSALKHDTIILTLVMVICISVLLVIAIAMTTAQEIKQARAFATDLALGNFNTGIKIRGHSETAYLMRTLDDARLNLKQQLEWMKDLGHDNRRKEMRRSVVEVISIGFHGHIYPTHTLDVSRSGLCIRAVEGLERDLQISIQYSDGSEKKGRIAWVRSDKAGVQLLDVLSAETLVPNESSDKISQ